MLPKLPAVNDDEFPSGLYNSVDLESCRIAEMIANDGICQNAVKNSDKQEIRIEIEEALRRAVNVVAADSIELYGRYQSSDSFMK